MDDDNASIGGSIVSLNKKPPLKGRKKKSAAAKLALKNRQNSEGGSEYGSSASLQKGSIVEGNQSQSDTATVDKTEPKTNRNLINGRNVDEKSRKGSETDISSAKQEETSSKDKDEVTTHKDSPPKPQPRRLSERKVRGGKTIPDDLKDGVVVSIYDQKVDTRPPRSTEKKTGDTKETKRELFTSDKRLGKDTTNENSSSGKLSTRLNSLSDLPPLKVEGQNSKTENVELSPPVPMDSELLDEEKNGNNDIIDKNAPSDATVHRFRAMRMTPDRSKSEESLRNVQFIPKPPSTPKSARKALSKGEKRNREANSSGEEADMDAKKQNSFVINGGQINTSLSDLRPIDGETMEIDQGGSEEQSTSGKGLKLHPNVMEVSDDIHDNINQNMNNDFSEDTNKVVQVNSTGALSGTSSDISPDKYFNHSPDKLAFESSPEKPLSSPKGGDKKNELEPKKSLKKADKKKGKKPKMKMSVDAIKLAPLDGSDLVSPGKSSIDTIGSATDLQAITDNYRQALTEKSPGKTFDLPGPGPSTLLLDKVIPEPKLNAGKLMPIQPKNQPPPLPQDMKSTSLRTTYKTDPAYPKIKLFGKSFPSEKQMVSPEMMSQRSLLSGPGLNTLSTREARNRMKQGSIGSQLLSSSELDRYFPNRKVGLWVGSWNMAEIKIKKDCKESLDDFLLPEISEYVQDIYAIGTQENAMNKKEWEILLQETIGPSHVLFHSASHGALHLAVFIKRDLIWFCTVPEDDLVQTRAVTMVKTKGAIAISFQFFGTTFVFINCHFAPGDDKKKERLDDFHKIIKNLMLPKQGNTGSPNNTTQDVTTRFDCVFWMGDLNFRIELYKGKQAVEDVVRSIREQEHPNFEDLVSGDQLTKLIIEGGIFQGFQEGRINFRPTYKFDIGQDTYDTSSKNRIPSYTDRVLFRAKKKNAISCIHYDSPSSIRLSDHKPVFALFEAAIKPARECNMPLAAGQFDRAVYTEANKRRSMKVEVINTLQNNEKSSKTCSIQ